MKRPKRFLSLILILLIINTVFFALWYLFDLQGMIKRIAEREVGKALNGKARITELSIGERQVLVKGFVFVANDNSLVIRVAQVRVKYNLLKVLGSGLKLRNILDKVEINRPEVTLRLFEHQGRTPGVHKPFRVPDLSRYFRSLSVSDGKFTLLGDIPVKIVTMGNLVLREDLTHISLTVDNTKFTRINVTAQTNSGGLIKAQAILDRARLAQGEAEISNLSPRYIEHPDIKGFDTELNLAISGHQPSADSGYLFDAQAFIWNTHGLFLDKYPVEIPFISASSNGKHLITDISSLKVGSSAVSANIRVDELMNDPTISGFVDLENLDLGLAEIGIEGNLRSRAEISGKLQSPVIELTASSDKLKYAGYTVSDLSLKAGYDDKTLSYELTKAVWNNQIIKADGVADLELSEIAGSLTTFPIESSSKSFSAIGTADYTIKLYGSLPEVNLSLVNTSVHYSDLSLSGVNGDLSLIPGDYENGRQSYFTNCQLTSQSGFELNLIGDVLDQNLLLDIEFADSGLADLYQKKFLTKIEPVLSGHLKAIMSGNSITTRSDLHLTLGKDFAFKSDFRVLGNYELKTGDAALHIDGMNGSFNDRSVDLQLSAQKTGDLITVNSFRINDIVSLSGTSDLKDLSNTTFDLSVVEISSKDIDAVYPDNNLNLPDFAGLSIVANYDNDPEKFFDARINLREFNVEGIYPLAAKIRLIGPPDECLLSGDVFNAKRNLVRLTGDLIVDEKVQLNARARVEDLSPHDIVFSSPIEGSMSGVFSAVYTDLLGMLTHPVLSTDVHVSGFKVPGVEIDAIDISAKQDGDVLSISKLSAKKPGFFKLNGSGALDYNVLNNRFIEGDNELQLAVEGELFSWVDGLVDHITDAGGKSTLNCSIGTNDEQFVVKSGNLSIRDGYLKLKDQAETVRDIVINGNFDDNKFILDKATFTAGPSKIILANHFQEDISNHFQIGFIDLGVFDLSIDEPGVLANIPLFTPPKSLANVSIKGQKGKTATVMGPFDDMKISAHAFVSNASAIYPPNTDNLLKMIYSMRGVTVKDTGAEPAPLPFKLDLMITLQENVSYVTYPTNFKINPGSYLHIIYDGHTWHLDEANFTSERGSIDFFGTVFENQNLNVFILESREIIQIDGNFVKRAPDGTNVTLKVTTDNDTKKSFLNRLQFDLSSDNPDDRSITSVLSRLRYNQTEDELSNSQRQNLLSDEAVNLIGGNLNTSLLNPILYPIENSIRRVLKLDTFSIKVGFIQNLFTEYSTDPDKLADFTDLKQFNNDVMQFSSSILLNNLSLSLSKYLGKRLFLDYSLTLQEATDLQKNTVVLVAHDTSLRFMLPYKLRLSYDLKYEPKDDIFTHGVMLKRSFVFDGF